MKAQVAAVLFAFITTGCVASGGIGVTATVPTVTADVQVGGEVAAEAPAEPEVVDDDLYGDEPDLVPMEGNANIRIVYGYDTPVFYSDGYYWRWSDGGYMRSSVHTGGWAVYGDVPVHIRGISNPVSYRNYKPAHYTPRARKVGVRPANSRASYHPVGHSAAHRNYNNNRPNTTHKTSPGYKQPAHTTTHTTPTHTTPAHHTTPTHTTPGYKAPATTKTTTTTTTKKTTTTTAPAPKKDPPKKYDPKDKRK
jgi:hypothetical protein